MHPFNRGSQYKCYLILIKHTWNTELSFLEVNKHRSVWSVTCKSENSILKLDLTWLEVIFLSLLRLWCRDYHYFQWQYWDRERRDSFRYMLLFWQVLSRIAAFFDVKRNFRLGLIGNAKLELKCIVVISLMLHARTGFRKTVCFP